MANQHFQRGKEDGLKGRRAIFRSTRAHGIVATYDDDAADRWDDEARADYLRGYEVGSEEAFRAQP